MKLADIDEPAVLDVLSRLPDQFRTKHLSQDRKMVAAHSLHQDEWSYNPMVGKYLSKERDALSLVLLDDRPHRDGVLWEKRDRLARPS